MDITGIGRIDIMATGPGITVEGMIGMTTITNTMATIAVAIVIGTAVVSGAVILAGAETLVEVETLAEAGEMVGAGGMAVVEAGAVDAADTDTYEACHNLSVRQKIVS